MSIDTIDTSARSFNQFYRPDPFIDDFVSGTTVLPLFDSCDALSGGPPAILSIYQIKKAALCFLSRLLDLVWSMKQKVILKKNACFLLFSVKPPRHRQTCGNWANTINVACGVALWAGNDSGWVKAGDVGHDEEDLARRGTGGGGVGDNWRGYRGCVWQGVWWGGDGNGGLGW